MSMKTQTVIRHKTVSLSVMSQLLGQHDCIESLRKDLVDLQGAVLDVFSRTGAVRFPSWKFPNKLSCKLDMVALLEQYDFVDGEDAVNQLSHMVLLELVIDRLLLLLQSFNSYIEYVRCSQQRAQTPGRGCLSIGLVVRNYWSSLLDFVNLMVSPKDLIQKPAIPKRVDCGDCGSLSYYSPQEHSQGDRGRQCLSAWSTTSPFKLSPHSDVSPSPSHHTPCSPTGDIHSVSSQTVELSLTPCDACHQVQSVLRKTGNTLVKLFESEGLPSSLKPLLSAVEDTLEQGYMTAGDITQLANEQRRDMRRLGKHLQDVRNTVDPLRNKVQAAEAENKRLGTQMEKTKKEVKLEIEKHKAITVQMEFSLKKSQRALKATEKTLEEKIEELKKDIMFLEESNFRLKEKVVGQQDTLLTLEREKFLLQDKVKTEEEAGCKLRENVQQLEGQISETQLLLDKENTKFYSACRQQESMQAKQRSLLERVDALDEECEELQRQLSESEERHISLENELRQMSKEKEQLQNEFTQQQKCGLELQKEKQMLEANICKLNKSVAEMKEYVDGFEARERLLVAFPELSPLAQAQPQSTGNVLLDMEKQMHANRIRIKILEGQNTTLDFSLEKLRNRAQRSDKMELSPQQQRSPPLFTIAAKKQQTDLKSMQKNRPPSRGPAHLVYSKRAHERGAASRGSEDRLSAAATRTSCPSPPRSPSQTINQIALHLTPPPHTGTKKTTKTLHTSALLHSSDLNQRRK